MFRVWVYPSNSPDWLDLTVEPLKGPNMGLRFSARFHRLTRAIELGRCLRPSVGPAVIGVPGETFARLRAAIEAAVEGHTTEPGPYSAPHRPPESGSREP